MAKVLHISVAVCITIQIVNTLRDITPPGQDRGIGSYVNSWAVSIRGGSAVADTVAHRNGFTNLGLVRPTTRIVSYSLSPAYLQVEGFKNVYHFQLKGRDRRNIRSDVPHASTISLDKFVRILFYLSLKSSLKMRL